MGKMQHEEKILIAKVLKNKTKGGISMGNLRAVRNKAEGAAEMCGCNCKSAGDVIEHVVEAKGLLEVLASRLIKDENLSLDGIKGDELNGLIRIIKHSHASVEKAIEIHTSTH